MNPLPTLGLLSTNINQSEVIIVKLKTNLKKKKKKKSVNKERKKKKVGEGKELFEGLNGCGNHSFFKEKVGGRGRRGKRRRI